MFVDIHTHQKSGLDKSILNVILGKEDVPKNSWFSLGIHPWYIEDEGKQFDMLNNELNKSNDNFLFIGECGLDKLNGVDFDKQEKAFSKQILLSEKYSKPLIIHCVKAYNELLRLNTLYKPKQKWVIHGFNKKFTIASSLIEKDICLSFGFSFLNSDNGKEVLKKTPIENVFLETDDDSRYSIEDVYVLASEILEIDIQRLKNRLKDNLWRTIG